ncbi:MAG TPA: hypothetical protein VFJ74_17800 [Gemmatimonadaceae bacterium]|nr:hypothetical protein [Gemmatimonadaceae bacterium]
MHRHRSLSALPALFALTAAAAGAQEPPRDSTRDSAHVASDIACEGRRIDDVEVRREPPRIIGRNAPKWRRTVLSALFQHRTTAPGVVSDLVHLQTGATCTAVGLAESERVLRAQPFLADARVHAEPGTGGGTHLVVETVDEIPLILSGSLSGGGISSLRYGSANVRGTGQLASLGWRQGNAFRDGIAARYEHYHLLNGPNTLGVVLDRAPIGGNAVVALAHPFLTPLQHVALFSEYRLADGYRNFLHADSLTRSLAVRRTQLAGGGVYRVARAGGGALSGVFVGAVGTYEHVTVGDESVHIDGRGITPDPDPLIAARYHDFDRTRVAAVVGVSALSFMRVTGFDALEGTQDVGRGAQLTLRAGPQGGTGLETAYGGMDAYAGVGSPASFVGMRFNLEGEGRGFGSWGEVVTSGRLAWYHKPAERRTLIVSGEYSGAWNARLPYQLTLADRRAGLSGFRKSDLAGARRLVGRGEHRWSFRRGSSAFAGLGAALFAQVGKTWAGDVPYGATINPRASAGVSLLGAIPRNSRRLLRADLAVPIAHDRGVRWIELRFSTSAPFRGFWREPGDIALARAAAPSSDVFTWP